HPPGTQAPVAVTRGVTSLLHCRPPAVRITDDLPDAPPEQRAISFRPLADEEPLHLEDFVPDRAARRMPRPCSRRSRASSAPKPAPPPSPERVAPNPASRIEVGKEEDPAAPAFATFEPHSRQLRRAHTTRASRATPRRLPNRIGAAVLVCAFGV